MNSAVTLAAREKLARARTGEASLPAITGMVFGNGAVDEKGEVLSPIGSNLQHELLRKAIDRYEKISTTCYRYVCTLEKEELAGERINEIGLCDSEGDILLMKSFTDKNKDSDMQMIFTVDDMF